MPMNENFWYFVVIVLVVMLVVNQVAQMMLARKSVEASKDQYPADTIDKMRQTLADGFKSMLEMALNASKKTEIPWDDQGIELVALMKGYQAVKADDGTWKLSPINSPPAAG